MKHSISLFGSVDGAQSILNAEAIAHNLPFVSLSGYHERLLERLWILVLDAAIAGSHHEDRVLVESRLIDDRLSIQRRYRVLSGRQLFDVFLDLIFACGAVAIPRESCVVQVQARHLLEGV